jgi:hypothetical protein
MRIRCAACVFPPLLFELLFLSLEHALLLELSGLRIFSHSLPFHQLIHSL